MSFLISDAMAQAPAGPPGGGAFSWLFLIGMFAIMYFFLIRPQVKRQKEHKKMVEALKKGDEVQTIGGLMGKVTDIGENFIKLDVADDVTVTVRRAAVETIMPKGSLKELT
jgi:preprotein translocase subunit YajC